MRANLTFLRRGLAVLCAAAVLLSLAEVSSGQQPAAKPAPPKYRHLAKGVETTIPILRDTEETVSYHDIVDILHGTPDLAWTPNYVPKSKTLGEMVKSVPFRRTIWNLEFTFKPLRLIDVDIRQSDGRMVKKTIWYMVYRVKNMGGHLQPKLRTEDETITIEPGAQPEQVLLPKGTWGVTPVDKVVSPLNAKGQATEGLTFMPLFVLESYNLKTPKAYTDHVIPAAIPLIQRREDINRKLLSTVEIATKPIPLSTDRIDQSVWGVVTWEDVDPSGDYYSMYLQGLTNAYKWTDDPAQVNAGEPGKGRKFTQRTLKMNFWRPGDEFELDEREIRFGTPGKVDYEWVWRP